MTAAMSDTFQPLGDLAQSVLEKAALAREKPSTGVEKWDGAIIREPGLYADIPIETYHGNPYLCDGPSISSTGLKEFIERPSRYWGHSIYNPRRYEKAGSKAANLGQAAHCIILGEGNFCQRFAVRPDTYPNNPNKKWNGNSEMCKSWIDAQGGKQIITSKELEAVQGISESLSRRPEVKNGILDGLIETSMIAKVKGIWLRSRPDVVPVYSSDHADLKITHKSDYEGLQRTIFDFGHHIQAAVCRICYRELFGAEAGFNYALIFCESSPPYDVFIHQLESPTIDLGEKQVHTALEYLGKCIGRMEWPSGEGFNPIISNIGLPSWAKTKIEADLAYMKQEIAS